MTTNSSQVALDERYLRYQPTEPAAAQVPPGGLASVAPEAPATGVAARLPLEAGDPRRVGRYRLTARLGSGGMGVVYLGVAGDGRLVAVKVMRPELADNPEFRARFGREVVALARVRGARILRVIETGAGACGPFLVTEYAAGPSLAGHVDRHGPVRPGELCALAAGLAEALTVIHGAGVVHRDLKPSNVILTGDGPKVIDFGIAQVLDAVSLTRTGTTIGSAGFMAPEQFMGQAGPAADVFAWAVTIGYAASGQPPFGAGPTDAVVYRILHAEPSIAAVPEALRPVVAAALAKDPQDRPAAHEILDQLRSSAPASAWPRGGTSAQADLAWPSTQSAPRDRPAPAAPPNRRPGPRPRLTGRRTRIAVLALALAVAAALTGTLLAGHGPGRPQRASVSGPLAASPFGIYPGQQDRGVFQTISRIAASGRTIVTTGTQVSDSLARQQFFASADGGATWKLAAVRAPGGGQPPPGYPATRLAAGPRGWLATGPDAIWTSRDGLSWTLAATHGITPQRPGDQVFVLTGTSGGFLAAGQAQAPGGKTQAVMWTSGDGVTWQRMTAAQAGLGNGVLSISYATSSGQDTMISGTLDDGASGTWRSTDGGQVWRPVTVPTGHGAGTGITGLAADGSGLVAVRPGTAGDGVAYFSPNGRSWQYSATLGAAGGFTPQVVKGSADGFVVTGTDAAGNYIAYTAAGDGAAWLPTGSLGTTASYASTPAATVAPGGTVIAAGSTTASKTSQQAVLLQASTSGLVRPVNLAALPGAVVPEVAVHSQAAADGTQIAVGSADGHPAIWRNTPRGSWTLLSTPSQVSATPGLAALTTVTHGRAGWLAVGVPGPVIYTSVNGTTWQPATVIARDLAGVVGVAATAGPRGYVIVGKLVAPGGSCVADVWWSPDLTTWTRARDVNDTTGSSQVLAVTADDDGFYSAGSHDAQPAVWTTTDGRTWTTIVLPLPHGATGVLQQIATGNDRLIALGTQTSGGVSTALAELSTDDGATWRQVPFGAPGPDPAITALTGGPGGFTATIQTGAPAQPDVTTWTSPDGATWTPAPGGAMASRRTH